MINDPYNVILLVAVVWPLLLALPSLHSRISWPCHLALIPALALAVYPSIVSLPLPKLFLGTRLAVNGEVRWILVMCVAIWFVVATVIHSTPNDSTYHFQTSYFLLALTGNLGAILATELIGFFCFSTLMSYSFYGLLIYGSDKKIKSSGRLYIIFLVLADVLLLEALLLAASTTNNLDYPSVRQIMAEAIYSQFYFWLVIIGFSLKAGIWPVHQWLLGSFKSGHQSAVLLLGGVPVAIGLLGALRWLPIGEHSFYATGMVVVVTGVAAIFYALWKLITYTSLKMLPAWVTVAATGVFIVVLGIGSMHPAIWRRNEYLMHPFIATLGIFLVALILSLNRWQGTHQEPDFDLQRVNVFFLWAEKGFHLAQQWTRERFFILQSYWNVDEKYQDIMDWAKPTVFIGKWSTSITFFVFLGLVLAWLAA